MKINIIGAGMGGLSAALALHDAGHDVTVYEGTEKIQPLGVGINLLPHASVILQSLGVVDELLEAGVATRELSYYNKYGQHIWTEPRGKFGGFSTPQISLGRGNLQMTLLKHARARLGEDKILAGHRLKSFRNEGDEAVAVLQRPNGETVETRSEILICADGIHSAAREQMYPDQGLPRYAGRVLWRGVTWAKPYLTGASMIMAGHQSEKFVCYPISPVREDGKQLINWIAELNVPELLDREDWNREGRLDDFYPVFKQWNFDWLDVVGLIEDAEGVYEFPLVDRDPVETWVDGHVMLLGDAAHPMYPIGSNGATQAIIDALCITRSISEGGSVSDILARYEGERLSATAAIVRANRKNGPEQCMQLAHERAPEGFDRLEDIFAEGELQDIADRYKQLTGLKKSA